MARSLSTATRLVAAISETAALAMNRRGYAASSAAMMRSVEEKASPIRKKKRSIEGLIDSSSSSWVPDPVTGYYRPANRVGEVDPAELRQRLLSNNRARK